MGFAEPVPTPVRPLLPRCRHGRLRGGSRLSCAARNDSPGKALLLFLLLAALIPSAVREFDAPAPTAARSGFADAAPRILSPTAEAGDSLAQSDLLCPAPLLADAPPPEPETFGALLLPRFLNVEETEPPGFNRIGSSARPRAPPAS